MITRDRRSRSASAHLIAQPTARAGSHTNPGARQSNRAPPIENRDDAGQPGTFRLAQETAESEDHEPLIFPDDLDGRPQNHEHQDDCQYRRKDEFLPRHTRHSRPVKARSANKRVVWAHRLGEPQKTETGVLEQRPFHRPWRTPVTYPQVEVRTEAPGVQGPDPSRGGRHKTTRGNGNRVERASRHGPSAGEILAIGFIVFVVGFALMVQSFSERFPPGCCIKPLPDSNIALTIMIGGAMTLAVGIARRRRAKVG